MGRRRRRTTLSLAAAAMLAAGCGETDDYANEPRPPAPINVSAVITEEGITVSPNRFGAGPVVLLISNQTDRAHRVTLESDTLGSDDPGVRQTTGPINPQGTASLKVDVDQGQYVLGTADEDVEPARIRVGEERDSAQDLLLQP